MYRAITRNNDTIFDKYCRDNIRVQDCPVADKQVIFNQTIPDPIWFDISALVESKLNCSGFGTPLAKFYFTNKTYLLF